MIEADAFVQCHEVAHVTSCALTYHGAWLVGLVVFLLIIIALAAVLTFFVDH